MSSFNFRCWSAFITRLTDRDIYQLPLLRFETWVKEELVDIQLMRMNYVPDHSRHYADSERIICVGGP